MPQFYTHRVTFTGFIIAFVSCKEVIGTVAVSIEAERTRSVVENNITELAGAFTDAVIRTGAATHAVDMARLTAAFRVWVCCFGTLRHAVWTILEVTARVTLIRTLSKHT